MGQRRESTVLSDKEKEATAYHEGGHAVLAYVLPDADPVHKVTILPTGMALGVTQQLPIEERHTYWREYIEDALCVMMGGRCAEQLVLGSLSTGRQQRPAAGHRDGPQDGPRVRHERADRPDGVGPGGAGVPGRGPHALPGLQRRDLPGHRRGGRAHPAGAGGPGQPAAHRAPPGPGRGGRTPCSRRRPSTAPRSAAWSTRPTAARSTRTRCRSRPSPRPSRPTVIPTPRPRPARRPAPRLPLPTTNWQHREPR